VALTAANVRVGITGAAYVAPRGTALPTTFDETLNVAFADLGYLSEDGLAEPPEEDTEQIIAWQNATVVRTVTTSYEARFTLKLIETKKSTLELYHKGSTVQSDGDTGFKIEVKGANSDRRSFVFDVVDGPDRIRIVIPDGEVVERGEILYVNEEPVGYEVTLTAYPDSSNTLYTKLSGSAAWNAS
jgi:hypothetical protein